MIAIIVCAYNNIVMSRRCIASVRNFTDQGTYKIIFVDDGSTDETKNWALEQVKQSDFVYLNHKNNQGYIISACDGVGHSIKHKYDYIFMLNNDVAILDKWLNPVMELFRNNQKLGIVGALGHKVVNGIHMEFVSGSRLIARVSMIRKIGFYDRKMQFGYWEDVELSWRAQISGWDINKHTIPSIHNNGSTFRYNHMKCKYQQRNLRYFESKLTEYYKVHKH